MYELFSAAWNQLVCVCVCVCLCVCVCVCVDREYCVMYKNSNCDRILHDVGNFLTTSNQNYHQAKDCTIQSSDLCRGLSNLQVVHTGSLAHLPSYSRGNGSYLLGLKWPERETGPLILLHKLRMIRAISPQPLCTCFHGVSRDYFNLCLYCGAKLELEF